MAGQPDDGSRSTTGQSFVARGERLAAALAGAWRREPPPLEMSEAELNALVLGLLRSKTGALAWWRVRHTPLRASPAGARLRNAYHNHGFQTALHARNLTRIVARLRDGGVEPVLVKGPAIARLYPERGLRPFTDLDLCVRPDRYDTAAAILRAGGFDGFSPVDLHAGFKELAEHGWDAVYARSQLVTLSGHDVRVLAAEDHLRLLCLHLLRHGVPIPLWLCDVAVTVESRAETFDWNLVLGSDPRSADWVACTIGLAHRVLGANVDGTPVAARAAHLPRWLVPSVLERWGRQCPVEYEAPQRSPDVASLLTRAPQALREYWPSPVAATVHLGRRFTNYPRMPLQVVDAVARIARFGVRRLLGQRPELDHF